MMNLYKLKLIGLIAICLLHSPFFGLSQNTAEIPRKTATLIRIWGFLKYYHPAVTHGSVDWDKVFIDEADSVASINTKNGLNEHLGRWFASLGPLDRYPERELSYDTIYSHNSILEWINDTDIFSTPIRKYLADVVRHRSMGANRFVQPQKPKVQAAEFINEQEYTDKIYPKPNWRLLALARFWNYYEYFYPYKYILDQPWGNVLDTYVPEIETASDTLSYVRVLRRLFGCINDSHTFLKIPEGVRFTSFNVPVRLKVFSDKAIITTILNDSLAKQDDLRYGDVILAVNDTSVGELANIIKPIFGGSNISVLRRSMGAVLFGGKTPSCKITFERGGIVSTKIISRYELNKIDLKKPNTEAENSYKSLNDSVGYINMGKLEGSEIKDALNALSDKKAIIFDLKNYPNFIVYPLCNKLCKENIPFALFTAPDYNYPGRFVKDDLVTIGAKNGTPLFEGKVVVLVNEITQSRAEFTAMALRALPNTVVVGSQTAGADGNAVSVVLPGGYSCTMSGLGVYYPNGSPTQRIGIKPDIYVEPTIEGIRQKRDEVLERAMLYCETGK